MSESLDWYNQLLVEAKVFLDQFEDNEIVAVYRDSEIIAVLTGLFEVASLNAALARSVEQTVQLLSLMDSGPLFQQPDTDVGSADQPTGVTPSPG